MNLTWYLVVSALVFCIGLGGILTRRNPLVILLCLELMLNAGNLALVAFARAQGNQQGQVFALIGSGLSGLDGDGAPYKSPFGEPAEVGRLFLTRYLVAFELASLLLLIAAVGAVILARRRTGLEDAREISVSDLMRDPQYKGTVGDAERGTLLEAGGPPHR